jgi:HD-GYP domain-containing protein (c-di-GMP phosphodiesterase class II)
MTKGHLTATRILAAKIYSVLPEKIKAEANLPVLQQAAMLHDYGKVLIPQKVLNKPGALTPDERKIMQLHSELGYELLKDQGVNDNVLRLIKYHHQNADGNGYPKPDDDFEYDINIQILHVADMYSALTEDRVYRKACTKEEAFEKIQERVNAGFVSQEVLDALKKGLN